MCLACTSVCWPCTSVCLACTSVCLPCTHVLGLYQRVFAMHQHVLGLYQRVPAVHPCAWLVPACACRAPACAWLVPACVCRAPACACHRCCRANSSICAMRPPCYPFLEQTVILGVLYGSLRWRVCNPVTYQRMARVAGNADMARTCCVWAAILPLCRSMQPMLCRWVFLLLDAGCVLVRTAPVSPAPVSHCGRWVRAQATVGCRLLERSLFPIKEGSQSS
jgi:hypothetical protein